MSAYKYVIGLIVLVAALLTVTTVPAANGAVASYASGNKSHHLIIGYRMPGDRLVYKEDIIRNPRWLRVQEIEETVIFKNERITMAEVLDQNTKGNGAFVSILAGGPGHNNVTLRFKSQRGRGIEMVLQLYARS